MFLDASGIPQVDLSYALSQLATIDGFNISGYTFDQIQEYVEMNGGLDMDMVRQAADSIYFKEIDGYMMTLNDLQRMRLDTSDVMDSILGDIINGDLTGWYMN